MSKAANPDMAAILQRLDVLESKEQIRNLVNRYSRAVDRLEVPVAAALFWPDGTSFLRGVRRPFLEHMTAEKITDIVKETHHH